MPERIQMRRTKGWRKPRGVIYCGRPGPYGNPFPVDGDWITWAAVAAGYRADRRGRQQAAVAFHRAWMTGEDIEPGQVHLRCVGTVGYSDGSTCTVADHARGVALVAANLFDGPILPERPSLDAFARLRPRLLVRPVGPVPRRRAARPRQPAGSRPTPSRPVGGDAA